MNGLVKILVVCFILTGSPAFPWSGECVWVQDGDSMVVTRGGKPEEIRLHGIDCPELVQAFGLEAARFTASMVMGKPVEVQPLEKKTYGRTIATVFVDDKCLNKELVRAGLAWWYQFYAPNDSDLIELQIQAMKNKVNIWSEADPTPPWMFRRKGKKGSSESTEPE